MTPLVDEERRRLSIGGLDPGREETSLVRLEEEELVEILQNIGQQLVGQLDMMTRLRTASVIFSTGSMS